MIVWRILRSVPGLRSSPGLSRFMSSQSQSPTFSNSDSQAIAKLGPHNIVSMIMRGKPNIPFPSSYQVDLDTFTPAALSAVSLITEAMADQQWDSLEGLVEENCRGRLRNIIQNLSHEENQLVHLNPEDVFFSFVSNADNCRSGNNLNLVTFSNPKLGIATTNK